MITYNDASVLKGCAEKARETLRINHWNLIQKKMLEAANAGRMYLTYDFLNSEEKAALEAAGYEVANATGSFDGFISWKNG
jgi:hypothetical protein